MRAIILAAGQGLRIRRAGEDPVPKILLNFGGKSLLERHLLLLRAVGVREIVLALGFRREMVEAELDRLGWRPRPEIVLNPRFTQGSMLTVDKAVNPMTRGGEVLLMDGDVLYDLRIARALVNGSEGVDRILIDREFESGEEPVKFCLREGVPVEFRKRLPSDLEFDVIGESVGFFRFSESAARELATIVGGYVAREEGHLPHEEAVRDLLLGGRFAMDVCDVTGAPWIEIDFPSDVERAEHEILPLLQPIPTRPQPPLGRGLRDGEMAETS
jgi:choline kinase